MSQWFRSVNSTQSNRFHPQPHDTIEYKTSFKGRWRTGTVEALGPHMITVKDSYTQRLHTIEPGRRGKVRDLHGADLIRAQARIEEKKARHRFNSPPSRWQDPGGDDDPRCDGSGPAAPALDGAYYPPDKMVMSTVRPLLCAIPRPPARYRSRPYLDFVRAHACCACEAPPRSEAHHTGARGVGQKADDHTCVPLCAPCHRIVTDTGSLPGLGQGETLEHLVRIRLALLEDYVSGRMPRPSWKPAAHRLLLVAGMLVIILLTGPAWAAKTPGSALSVVLAQGGDVGGARADVPSRCLHKSPPAGLADPGDLVALPLDEDAAAEKEKAPEVRTVDKTTAGPVLDESPRLRQAPGLLVALATHTHRVDLPWPRFPSALAGGDEGWRRCQLSPSVALLAQEDKGKRGQGRLLAAGGGLTSFDLASDGLSRKGADADRARHVLLDPVDRDLVDAERDCLARNGRFGTSLGLGRIVGLPSRHRPILSRPFVPLFSMAVMDSRITPGVAHV